MRLGQQRILHNTAHGYERGIARSSTPLDTRCAAAQQPNSPVNKLHPPVHRCVCWLYACIVVDLHAACKPIRRMCYHYNHRTQVQAHPPSTSTSSREVAAHASTSVVTEQPPAALEQHAVGLYVQGVSDMTPCRHTTTTHMCTCTCPCTTNGDTVCTHPTTPHPPTTQAGTISIREFLRGRTLFITGATGFLGKVLLEKILYEQPDVTHIYLLLQPRGNQSPQDRLVEQVLPSEAFSRLQERYGDGYSEFMMSKLTAVEGRLGLPQLGIDDATLGHLHEV